MEDVQRKTRKTEMGQEDGDSVQVLPDVQLGSAAASPTERLPRPFHYHVLGTYYSARKVAEVQ